MTRRLTGNSSRLRTPNYVLPIGHLSNKSTVCSPVSMSHMSQDLVKNHMRSHYQRVNSAKACVDTSAPKSLKLTIKERDRKRREDLQRSSATTPRPRSQQNALNDTFSRADSPARNGSSESHTRRNRHENQGEQLSADNMRSNMRISQNDSRQSISVDQNGYTQYERFGRRAKSQLRPPTDSLHWDTDINQNGTEELNGLTERDFERHYTSTPRLENGRRDLDDDEETPLRVSKMTFSYKESPSARSRKTKKPEEIIWTEEQKYLNFISEVTNDVLARGIFSNRVLLRVFESHIEKRKDELDEERMREMIDQLKEDLEITA